MLPATPKRLTDITARNASLPDLVELLRHHHLRRRDFVCAASGIRAERGRLLIDGADSILTEDGVTSRPGAFQPTVHCDNGIGAKLRIPTQYLQQCRTEDLDIYDNTVNGWLRRDHRKFMIRCLESSTDAPGVARAFLSDSYGIIDNLDILMAVLDGVRKTGIDVSVEDGGCDLTDRRMYIRLRSDDIRVMAPNLLSGYRSPFTGRSGDDNPVVWAGIIVSNSEVGAGKFTLTPRIVAEVCDNGMTIAKDALSKVHVGQRQSEGEIAWSEETVRRQLALIRSQTIDAVREFINPAYCLRVLRSLEEEAGRPIRNAHHTVTEVSKQLRFTTEQAGTILAHFYRGGTDTAAGVLHAVTSMAQTVPNADTAHAIEARAIRAMHLAAKIG